MKGGHQIWLDSRGDLYVGQNQEGHRILKYRRCRVGASREDLAPRQSAVQEPSRF
jgi:hypothetical protein